MSERYRDEGRTRSRSPTSSRHRRRDDSPRRDHHRSRNDRDDHDRQERRYRPDDDSDRRDRDVRRRSRSRSRTRSKSPPRKRRRSRSRSESRRDHETQRRSVSRSRSRDRTARRRHSRDRHRSVSSSSESEDEPRRKRDKKKRDSKRSESKERRKERKREKKEKKKKKHGHGHGAGQWGKYGVISEADIFSKAPEFHSWLVEERKINPETISKDQSKKEFLRFVEDFNTATLPHEKYYHMEAYERRMNALRQGEFVPPPDDGYDPAADLKAISGAHKKKAVDHDSYLSREQLQELRRVQQERVEAGKMRLLGMEVKQTMGVRMDGSIFED